jgi:hypothetical protein
VLPSRALRRCLALAALLPPLAASSGALAQELELPAPPDDRPGTPRPAAADERGGHIVIDARAAAIAPGGSFASGFGAGDVVSWGPGFGGTLGLGLGRHAVLEASGQYAFFSPAGTCASCSGSSWSLGLGLAYHVVQGSAVDAWVSYGLAFRATGLSTGPASRDRLPGRVPSIDYKGIDFARLAMGATFRPIPSLGFGPYAELDLGTYPSRPGPETSAATYLFGELGLRIHFDPVQLAGPTRPATVARR